ncbi:hypothetical protein FB45DRAFT_352808 [Roridomyces roridus]|uniref:Uncharacterized protein n=1 Tax=Roridomyces roridus TaxID=1738132 RepID=A0AAD7FV73_9AGAR|nr:hypothetical protein FB45DRAFT_352808 [Roridomyces roridus]
MARILGYDPGQHRERQSTVIPARKPIYDNRRSRYAGLGHGLPSHMCQCQRVFSSISVRPGSSRAASSVRTITQALYAEMTRGSTPSWDTGTVKALSESRDSHSPHPRAPELQLDLDKTPSLKRTWAAISGVVARNPRREEVAYIPARASSITVEARPKFVEGGI